MRVMLRVWDTIKAKVGRADSWSPHTPLWGNQRPPHFRSIPDPVIWARYSIRTLADIVLSSGLRSFDDLKDERGLPNHMFFRYLQLRHAYRTQFPQPITLEVSSVESIKQLSVLYAEFKVLNTSVVTRLFLKWQADIPRLADDDWEGGIQQYLPLMTSVRDRFTQLRFIHHAYYSPECLAEIYPYRSPLCPKCTSERGSFFHVIWSCQHLQTFWKGVVTEINSIGKLKVPCDPFPLLLGIVDTLETTQAKKKFVFHTAFYARKTILLKWNDPVPPSLQQWRALVDAALSLYKLTYLGRNCPKKFEKIWAAWTRERNLALE